MHRESLFMHDTVPLPLLVFGLLAVGSVITGVLLWLRDGFQKKTTVPLYVKPLEIRWYIVVLLGGAFFIIPSLIQLTGVLRQIQGSSVEHFFYSGVLVEFALVLFFLAVTAVSKKVRDGLRGGDFSMRLCVCGFLKILPLVLVTGLLWVPILNGLRRCGLPIQIEIQPLMKLLLQGQASTWSLAAIGCGAIILAPICEEIFFRGILLRFFYSFLPLTKSLWVSSFIFAAMHGNWMAFLPIAVVGYQLGRNYAESRNLVVGIGIHGLFNAFNFTLAVMYARFYAV